MKDQRPSRRKGRAAPKPLEPLASDLRDSAQAVRAPAVEATVAASLNAEAPTGPAVPAAAERPAPDQARPESQDAAQPVPGYAEFDKLSRNIGRLVEESQKVAAAYLERRARLDAPRKGADEAKDMVQTLGQVAAQWFTDPAKMMVAQATLSSQMVDLWAGTLRRSAGQADPDPQPEKVTDKRFAAPEWRELPAFDFIRQAYTITSDWANGLVEEAELDEETRNKARFYLRQLTGALSPSNFLATNPELLKHTFAEGGENLVRGMKMLAEDIAAGKGELKIRQSDNSVHQLGVNMAMTPGKVVYRNDLMELIQYAPATAEVYRRPLLIVPPWINKFYVLDLNPAKSFVKWAVDQGLTVFVISWVNPDERHADKDFESFMREGIFAALDAIEAATGERDVTSIGYCVGGTLLAVTLAYMALTDDRRISSATFFTAQTDFRNAGDLKVFANEEQIAALEAEMNEHGYLRGSKMANAFNMLRPNDLIWSYVVNNYLKGQSPTAFDLLTWNADSTRMPAANHSFYLRNCYLGNKLTQGEMIIGGETLDLGRVTIPVYNLATKEDHIAPAKSVFVGARFFGGPMRYVLAGSGHIAGVVNPPYRPKYQFWSGPEVGDSYEDWLADATETAGSWWPDWMSWIAAQSPDKVAARDPGGGVLQPLCDAPGEYVRVKS
ncbi:MAG: class I poly(R)-hydroxyalkanoic acid synthase [Janthinobacterium lividum]